MSLDVFYDPSNSTVANVVTAFSQVDLPSGLPNTLNNPDLSHVGGVITLGTCKADVPNHAIIPFTAQDQTAWNAALAAAQLASDRSQAQADIVSTSDLGKLERAVADILIGEINSLREWLVSFKVAVAGAGTLAALKTAVAALPDMPDRNLSQAKTAIISDIQSGNVD